MDGEVRADDVIVCRVNGTSDFYVIGTVVSGKVGELSIRSVSTMKGQDSALQRGTKSGCRPSGVAVRRRRGRIRQDVQPNQIARRRRRGRRTGLNSESRIAGARVPSPESASPESRTPSLRAASPESRAPSLH